jgi:hypothetical protein
MNGKNEYAKLTGEDCRVSEMERHAKRDKERKT